MIKRTATYYQTSIKLILFIVLMIGAMKPQMMSATSLASKHEVGLSKTTDKPSAETEAESDDGSLWFSEISYFGKSIVLVKALIIVIFASIIIMFVLLVLILLNRNRLERETVLKQYLLEKYQSLILDYLFGGSGIEGFDDIASDDYRRQVLIDQIIDISINLKGEAGEKLQQLFLELGLEFDSLQKAKSKRWHIKIKGFKELAFMNLKHGNEEIYKSLQSKNDILRMEAQIALVRLSEGDPFEWLYFQVQPFSLWEQITLHSMLVQHDIPVTNFSQWLDSPNHTVVMFALRMIREYKQTDDEDLIYETLHHEKDSVRQLAVEVCGDLGLKSSLKILKSRYKHEIEPIKLEIIKTMGKIPDESMLGFLKLVLDKEDDVQLQIESTKAIENMGEIGVNELKKLIRSEYKNYQIIIRHVLDKRIV